MTKYEVWASFIPDPCSLPYYEGSHLTLVRRFYWTLKDDEDYTDVFVVIIFNNKRQVVVRPVRRPKSFVPVDIHARLCCVCGMFDDECDCICGECGHYVFDDVTLIDHGLCYDCFQQQRLGRK